MNKALREQVKNKYGGKCAYSGTDLMDDWQVDHLFPKHFYQRGYPGNPDAIENLVPAQKIINHYKGTLTLEEFRRWYLGGLHNRLAKLPKITRVLKSTKRKEYLLQVASFFGITENNPFSGVFYFESLTNNEKGITP
jgi:hypothetical protein